ncbi:hypothetical protein HELRODRAFT_169685 [Helobdella robusta]|uniref:Uncharacterized protein n=1 Tax=Helobdella robusta TaxID=6412 RepID=T1F283_HELRO|nr:hypothetical protein HELRODRAFT_169685 [Helobdella robusta]ESO07970.1 hypothetical protein HELRODRAFT_169685 [Helobdella robusta]
MAALNFFSGKSSLSLSQGIRNYLYCCFPKDDKHETSQSKESVLNKEESGENLGYESELSRQTPEGGNDSLSKKSDSLKLMETTRCLDNDGKRASGEEASKVNMKKSLDTLLAAANTTTANNDDDDDGGGCGGVEDVAGVRVSLRSSAHNDADNGGEASGRGSRSSGVAGDRTADDDSVNSNSKQNINILHHKTSTPYITRHQHLALQDINISHYKTPTPYLHYTKKDNTLHFKK